MGCPFLRARIFFSILGNTVAQMLLWGSDGNILVQAFHAIFGVGTSISPWIIGPFVLHEHPKNTVNNTSLGNTTAVNNSFNTDDGETFYRNWTDKNVSNSTEQPNQETRIHIPFTFIMAWFAFVSILFFISYRLNKKEKIQTVRSGSRTKRVDQETKEFEPMWYRATFLILSALRFGFYCALEGQYAAFLTAFAVRGLGRSKTEGIALTSVFRTSFMISRVVNIGLALFIRPGTMIVIDLILLMLTYTILVLTVQHYGLAIWIGSALLGFGMSSFFAASISWVTENLKVTGKAAAIINLDAPGVMTLTFLIGHMFDAYGPMTFLYICMADSFFITLICVLTYLLARYYRKHYAMNYSVTEQNEMQ